MLIKKGDKLIDRKNNIIYEIFSIRDAVMLQLVRTEEHIKILFECTIDFAERNFELI
jgi:hypothetical protein